MEKKTPDRELDYLLFTFVIFVFVLIESQLVARNFVLAQRK